MIKAIIFDCFGVFYVDRQASLKDRFPDKQVELDDLRRQSDYGFIDRNEYVEAVAKLANLSASETEKIVINEHVINQPLVDFIKSDLRSQYKIGLLSNVGRGWLQGFFGKDQMKELFDTVVASGEEGIAKPHPQIFRLIAERLSVQPSECVMIDDIEDNCAGADAAGMKSIHYEGVEDVKQQLKRILAVK